MNPYDLQTKARRFINLFTVLRHHAPLKCLRLARYEWLLKTDPIKKKLRLSKENVLSTEYTFELITFGSGFVMLTTHYVMTSEFNISPQDLHMDKVIFNVKW